MVQHTFYILPFHISQISLFCHFFIQDPPISRSVPKTPKTIGFSTKKSDFDQNSRISSEICRNFLEMPRNLPKTRFSENHLTLNFNISPHYIFGYYFSQDPLAKYRKCAVFCRIIVMIMSNPI